MERVWVGRNGRWIAGDVEGVEVKGLASAGHGDTVDAAAPSLGGGGEQEVDLLGEQYGHAVVLGGLLQPL